MESIGFLFSFLLDARTATDRIFEVFDEQNTIVDPENPVSIAEPRGELAFHDVHFRYQDAPATQRDLLDGIDLVLRPGETMALVGLTGSGKTTLTTLPTRLYDVTGGRVTVDLGGCLRDRPGNDIRVFQAVSSEPVSVYVSPSPDGPFTLLEGRKSCGVRVNAVQGYCDFDLADGQVAEARYVRVEDGELWPCPGGTRSEGADLDAVQVLVAVGAPPGSGER